MYMRKEMAPPAPSDIPENELERGERESPEKNRERMDTILGIFGTDTARERFLALCERYYTIVREQKLAEMAGSHKKGYGETSERATFHNEIMRTLTLLAIQAKLTPEAKEVLYGLADRDKVTKLITDYFDTQYLFHDTPRITRLGKMREGFFE